MTDDKYASENKKNTSEDVKINDTKEDTLTVPKSRVSGHCMPHFVQSTLKPSHLQKWAPRSRFSFALYFRPPRQK